ncbi:MAG: hypothetical protein ACXAD7_27125 [Candidatus Kariarchaeaceae archaeon]|jgi:hypothetical protein
MKFRNRINCLFIVLLLALGISLNATDVMGQSIHLNSPIVTSNQITPVCVRIPPDITHGGYIKY